MVELRIRTPKKLSLTDKEIERCSLTDEQQEREALNNAVNNQIDQVIKIAIQRIRDKVKNKSRLGDFKENLSPKR